jgi:antitoxin Phd
MQQKTRSRLPELTSHLTSHIMVAWRPFMAWQVQHAKARFSEFLNQTLKKGPQVVTRRGVETAVFVSIDEWRRLQQQAAKPDWKSILLGGPRLEILLPERGKLRLRRPVTLD